MNWFWFALIALLCWSGSDLFSKIGCCGQEDRTAHLKMVVAVGVVMGLHAAYMVFFRNVVMSVCATSSFPFLRPSAIPRAHLWPC